MAKALEYEVKSYLSEPSGRTKAAALLEELSKRGTLDKVQLILENASAPISYLLERADTDSGREKVGNVALLLTAVGKIDASKVDRMLCLLLGKTRVGVGANSPSYLSILRRLSSAEVRRGVFLLVELLHELGRTEPDEGSHV